MNIKEKWFHKACAYLDENEEMIVKKLEKLIFILDNKKSKSDLLLTQVNYERYCFIVDNKGLDLYARKEYGLTQTLWIPRLKVSKPQKWDFGFCMLGMYILMWYHISGEQVYEKIYNDHSTQEIIKLYNKVQFFVKHPEKIEEYKVLVNVLGDDVDWESALLQDSNTATLEECDILIS